MFLLTTIAAVISMIYTTCHVALALYASTRMKILFASLVPIPANADA
jgi:hypothetical protein